MDDYTGDMLWIDERPRKRKPMPAPPMTPSLAEAWVITVLALMLAAWGHSCGLPGYVTLPLVVGTLAACRFNGWLSMAGIAALTLAPWFV
jgi:hypothetical protein